MFTNRSAAGRKLFDLLKDWYTSNHLLIAIPNGGVLVAAALTQNSRQPIYLCPVHKIHFPILGNNRYGIGAVDARGRPSLNRPLIEKLNLSEIEVEGYLSRAKKSLDKQCSALGDFYFNASDHIKPIVIVDDGLATGFTILAAVQYFKDSGSRDISVIAPVAHQQAIDLLQTICVTVRVLYTTSEYPYLVDHYYSDFQKVKDSQVRKILENNNALSSA